MYDADLSPALSNNERETLYGVAAWWGMLLGISSCSYVRQWLRSGRGAGQNLPVLDLKNLGTKALWARDTSRLAIINEWKLGEGW